MKTFINWSMPKRCFPRFSTPQGTFIGLCAITLILHLILVPCHAKVFQLPLKRFQTFGSRSWLASASHSHSASNLLRLYKRQAASADEVNLKGMRGNLYGLSGEGYYVDVNIGTPPQKLQVLIDTGSANFAIACEPDFNINVFFHRQNSSSYEEDGTEIYVPYTEGEWTGILGTDVMSLTSATALSTEANIACITSSRDFYQQGTDWVGILGLAYAELARPDSSITPFLDSLLASHPDLDDVFSIQLCGSSFVHTKEDPLMKGSLILGGSLPSLTKSEMFYAPLYKEWYYEVIIADIQVSGQSLGQDCKEYNMDKSIVDSGTTSIRLPVKIFDALSVAIANAIQSWDGVIPPGPTFYSGVETLCFAEMATPFSIFPIISFYLMQTENTSFRLDLTAQHYLRPVTTMSTEEGEVTQSCVRYGFAPSTTGTVLGAVLMEAFYVEFDRAGSRLGFAQTSCPLPDPTNKILDVTIQGPFPSNTSLLQCAFQKPETGDRAFTATSYILLALSMVICIPLVLLCVFHLKKFIHQRSHQQLGDDTSETRTVFSSPDTDRD